MILRNALSKSPLFFIGAPLLAVGALFIMHSVPGKLAVDSFLPQFPFFSQPAFAAALAALLISIESIVVNHLFNLHEFFHGRSNVPILVFTLTALALCTFEIDINFHASNLFVLAGLYRLFHVYRQPRAIAQYFECAFAFAVAALLYQPHLVLLPGLLMCIPFTRSFNWREYLVAILGFLFPFLIWLGWKFCINELQPFPPSVIPTGFQFEWPGTANAQQRVFLLSTIAVVVLSLQVFLAGKTTSSTKSRNTRGVFFILALWLFAGILVSGFWSQERDYNPLLLPVAFISSAWFSNYRYSLIAPFVFYCYLAVCLWQVFLP